ncbi:MAG: hypothetical protein OXR73_03255 [Myxococcales bacterium]|nr:hypothetical protein [Myxococcales bacterium]
MRRALWVNGIIGQAAGQLTQGEPLDLPQARIAHGQALVPWIVMWLVAAIPAAIAVVLIFTILLSPIGIGISLACMWAMVPAFVLEERRAAGALRRSFDLFKADWFHVLQGLAILIIATIPLWVASAVFGLVPVLGPLAPAAVTLVVTPFSTLYVFSLFRETRLRIENAGG